MKVINNFGYPLLIDLDSFSYNYVGDFSVSEITFSEFFQILYDYDSDVFSRHCFSASVIKSFTNIFPFVEQYCCFYCSLYEIVCSLRNYFSEVIHLVPNSYQIQKIRIHQVKFVKDVCSGDILVYIDFIPHDEYSIVFLRKVASVIKIGNSKVLNIRSSRRPKVVFSCLNLSEFSGNLFVG